MATPLPVFVWMGQSNASGQGLLSELPAALRGPQANRLVWNHDNNALETLNCDAVGANEPNHNSEHLSTSSALLRVAELFNADEGTVGIFVFAVSGSPMGPIDPLNSWCVTAPSSLTTEFAVRWQAFVAVARAAGYEPYPKYVFWLQGETDMRASVAGAYYWLYRYFIARVRQFLSDYTTDVIRWIAAIPGKITRLSFVTEGLIYVNIVRSALRKAGWDDPHYRVADMDDDSYQTDNVHLTTAGLMALADSMYAAAKLNQNNTMALETNTLGSMRQRLIDEFSIEPTEANIDILNDRINGALEWIVSRRKNWPWLERKTVIDVGTLLDSATTNRIGCACFTKGNKTSSSKVTYNAENAVAREFITIDSGTYLATAVNPGAVAAESSSIALEKAFDGDSQNCQITAIAIGAVTTITFSLTSATGQTVALPADFTSFPVVVSGVVTVSGPVLGGTYTATKVSASSFTIAVNTTLGSYTFAAAKVQIPRQFTIAQGLFELPEDFVRVCPSGVYLDSQNCKPTYRSASMFEKMVRESLIGGKDYNYTVISDPLNLNDKKYVSLYPYITGKDHLHVKYYGDTKKIVADDDIPDIPRSDRHLLFVASAWFVARQQKDTEMMQFYSGAALEELKKVMSETEFSDDSAEYSDDSDELTIPRSPGLPDFGII